MSQALRKLTGTISKTNTCCIFINQLRDKIGVMFGNPETTTGGNALKFYASVRLDIRRVGQIKDGEEILLTALEYRLLLTLIQNRGRIMSRSALLQSIWDVAGDFVNDNTLTVYIKRLREKIEDDPIEPKIIKTVRGMGYKVD